MLTESNSINMPCGIIVLLGVVRDAFLIGLKDQDKGGACALMPVEGLFLPPVSIQA